jgi:hypothetical protein
VKDGSVKERDIDTKILVGTGDGILRDEGIIGMHGRRTSWSGEVFEEAAVRQ